MLMFYLILCNFIVLFCFFFFLSVTLSLCFYVISACAYKPQLGKGSAYVINGDDADLGTWPWVVSLQDSTYPFECFFLIQWHIRQICLICISYHSSNFLLSQETSNFGKTLLIFFSFAPP